MTCICFTEKVAEEGKPARQECYNDCPTIEITAFDLASDPMTVTCTVDGYQNDGAKVAVPGIVRSYAKADWTGEDITPP